MPTILDKNHLVGTILDYEKEVNAPLKHGYYLESIARIDANIDRLLNALVRQIFGNNCCQSLFNSVEYGMKENYAPVSGLVRLDILKQTAKLGNAPNNKVKMPESALYTKIKKYKENRNKVLHSDRGHCALANPLDHSTNDSFQKDAHESILKTINSGKECIAELQELLQKNAITLGNEDKKFNG